MVVSTATVSWNGGTLVGAYGGSSEVLTELGTGADSNATMENREFLMAWGVFYNGDSSATEAGALWFNTKTKSDWEA